MKKILKKYLTTTKKIEAETMHAAEIEDNAINEAIEAQLASMLAQAPSAEQTLLRFRFYEHEEISIYSGCQVAGPQV